MQNLPREIQLLIISKMRVQDLMELRNSCASFRDLVDEAMLSPDYLHQS